MAGGIFVTGTDTGAGKSVVFVVAVTSGVQYVWIWGRRAWSRRRVLRSSAG